MTEHFIVWRQRFASNKDGCARAQAVLEAIVEGEAHVGDIEEWANERSFAGFFHRLEEVLIREQAFLRAYICVRAQGAEGDTPACREACLARAECPQADAKLLREAVRVGGVYFTREERGEDSAFLASLNDIARRAGVNHVRFLALLPAIFFLELCMREEFLHEAGFQSAERMMRFARALYTAFPEYAKEDMRIYEKAQRDAERVRLRDAGLSIEEWFVRLNTPFGPERGRVAAMIARFVRGVETEEDVRYAGQEHAHELRMRSATLRENTSTYARLS